jgi:predicted nucleic acid-binding OB-fold protein
MKNMTAQKRLNRRIILAYQKMNSKGKDALDKIVERLAKIQGENDMLFFNRGTNRKRPKGWD